MLDENSFTKKFTKDQVYEIEAVATPNRSESKQIDVAVVRIKGQFPSSRKNLRFRTQAVTSQEKLFVIGYPHGLPAKVAGDCVLAERSKNGPSFYRVLGDIFVGNSGSPLVDSLGYVVGMVLGGGVDRDVYKADDCPFIYNCDPQKLHSCSGDVIQHVEVLANSAR
jgi:hypothetical protein